MQTLPRGCALPQVKAGELRALAVTSAKRSPAAPDVPTVGTPPDVVEKLNAATVKALQTPEVRERLAAQGAPTSPAPTSAP